MVVIVGMRMVMVMAVIMGMIVIMPFVVVIFSVFFQRHQKADVGGAIDFFQRNFVGGGELGASVEFRSEDGRLALPPAEFSLYGAEFGLHGVSGPRPFGAPQRLPADAERFRLQKQDRFQLGRVRRRADRAEDRAR